VTASQRFRFRFVARGEVFTKGLLCTVESLRRCHPGASIVVVDANDEAALDSRQLPDRCKLVHLPPSIDEVARCVGRGSPRHLFHWRHSPDFLAALGDPDGLFDVHADTDMLFLRPMDLASLIPHLEAGRVAMAIDRSTIDYYRQTEELLSRGSSAAVPLVGSRGPLVQGGLLFRNPADDGGLLERMWDLVCADARAGMLPAVPWDDMAFLTMLLGHGGPLWGRLLPLGHEWNFISHEGYDPGVLGYVAHYGGAAEQKQFMIDRFSELFPSVAQTPGLALWEREPDIARVGYGRVGFSGNCGYDALKVVIHGKRVREALSLHPPFSVTWRVPAEARLLFFRARFNDSATQRKLGRPQARLLAYADGVAIADSRVNGVDVGEMRLAVWGVECITLVGLTQCPDYCHLVLLEPRWE
jgi:hypothetical protein